MCIMLTTDTFLFLDEADIHFTDMISELFLCLRPLDFKIMDDFHVSLSRTISIRHHWIQSFMESLKSKISSLSR